MSANESPRRVDVDVIIALVAEKLTPSPPHDHFCTCEDCIGTPRPGEAEAIAALDEEAVRRPRRRGR